MLRDRQRRLHRWPRAPALAILLLALSAAAAVTIAAPPSPSRQTGPSASETGVIRGRILDEEGAPVAGATVQARRAGAGADGRQPEVTGEATTDDRGSFQLIGLPPGWYLITAARPRPAAPGDNRPSAIDGPTYYPGVGAPEAATAVRALAGDPPPIEFRLRRVRLAQVSGTLLSYNKRPLLGAAVIMSPQGQEPGGRAAREARIQPDGVFAFGGVPPGRYVLRARGETEGGGASLFATFAVTVDGRDVNRIEMTLAPGSLIEGQVRIETRHGYAPPAGPLRVRAPLANGSDFGDTLSGAVRPDGSFRLSGVMPGTHVLMIEGLTFPWRIAQALLEGRDVAEMTFDVERDRRFRNVRVVVTDTAAGVTGTVAVAQGVAPGDALVIAFPADPLRRRLPLRFVRTARPNPVGAYRLIDLVPGEHLLVAVLDVDETQAKDATMLDRLAPVAARIIVAGAEVAEAPLRAVQARPVP